MTPQEYFKDKIDWKIFNMLIDMCTHIDDGEDKYLLRICVETGKNNITNEPNYGWIYTYSSKLGGSYTVILPNNLDEYIRHYEEHGLLFMLILYTSENKYLTNRLKNCKKITIKEKRCSNNNKKYLISSNDN